MPYINKEDLTLKEYQSLSPTAWIVEGVNYEKVEYFKEDNGKIWEIGYCTDGSLSKRIEELKYIQKRNEIMNSLGLR